MLQRALNCIWGRWSPEPKPVILMYHRIANEPVDPWGLTVSPIHFEEQLEVLRRTRRPLPLTEFVRRFVAGSLPSHAVALTFDDGYADNLLAGKPRLAAADVPATVFLASGYLDRPGEFWWDELARLLLLEACPRPLEIQIRGIIMHFEFGAETPGREADKWCAWSNPLTLRQKAYLRIWQALVPLGDDERQSVMAEIRSALGNSVPDLTSRRAMTVQDTRALVLDGLVTIGAHTVTHPMLTGIDADARHYEIVESKAACEALIGAPVQGFAYPHGDFDHRVRSDVEAADFLYACSTKSGPVVHGSDLFALPRAHVFDWDGDAFDRALRSSSR